MREVAHNFTDHEGPELIQPIEGDIDAFYKDGDHYRFVGKTRGDVDISVDIAHGEMLTDISGLTIQVKGEHAEVGDNRFMVYDCRDGVLAELDIEPKSRFRLKFLHQR